MYGLGDDNFRKELSLYKSMNKIITEIVMAENSISVLTKISIGMKIEVLNVPALTLTFVDILCKHCGSIIGFNFVLMMGY